MITPTTGLNTTLPKQSWKSKKEKHINSIKNYITKVLAEAWDHARCSGNCALIILEFMHLDFEALLKKYKKIPQNHKKIQTRLFGSSGSVKNSSGMYFSSYLIW